MTDDRTPFREARAAGKAKHQEQRLTSTAFLAIKRALAHLPETCHYHGDKLTRDYGLWSGEACCDTGKPALARREAEAALERLTP